MRGDELLILNYSGFSRHLRSLYWNMRDSRAYAELFVRDPVGVISKKVFPGYPSPPPGTLNQANRIMFSLLSNEAFMQFTHELQDEMEREARELAGQEGIDDFDEALRFYATRMDRGRLYERVTEGIMATMDRELLFSLTVRTPWTTTIDPDGPGGGDWCPEIPTGDPIDLCPDPKPGGGGSPMSTLAYAETVIVTVVVALAFVVVTVIDFTPKPAPPGLTREDVLAVSGVVAERLQSRAYELRANGVLTSSDAIHRGPQL